MKKPVIIIGLGEIGSVFTRGFLRSGHPVFPITRAIDINHAFASYPDPDLVIVAVGEKDLEENLQKLPDAWRSKCLLLQNELLPNDWEKHKLINPTVVSVWFEKKKGQDSKVLLPSPVYGPHAALLTQALATLDIPVKTLDNKQELLHELVLKNVYILTTNIAGLKTGGTVSELWKNHQHLARNIANDVVCLQEKLTNSSLDSNGLVEGMLIAFASDPDHNCMGRSALARLERAIELSNAFGLEVPYIREIQAI